MKKDAVAHEDVFEGSKIGRLRNKKELIMALEMTIPTHLTAEDILFACIGTDRVTGDAVGPIVGSILSKKKYNVIGTLDNPLHAMNLTELMAMAPRGKHIISIDACLGKQENIGTFGVIRGALKPGAGVGKELPLVGDTSINAMVNVHGFMEFEVLRNTRLSVVVNISQTIASAIHTVFKSRTGTKKVKELLFV